MEANAGRRQDVPSPAGIAHAAARIDPSSPSVTTTEFTGGVSAHVVGLEIAGRHESRRLVYREHRVGTFKGSTAGLAGLEFQLLAALRERGLPVPKPLGHHPGDDHVPPYLLMEWIDGSTDVAEAHVPAALRQMARFLAELHAIDPLQPPLADLHRLPPAHVALADQLPATPTGESVRRALDRWPPDGPANLPVLLHGDYWPGNVLWGRGGDLLAVIDWEDACLGDPLADLAAARCELLCRFGHEAMEDFTEHYLSSTPSPRVGPPPHALSAWEVYVSATALESMADWGLTPDEEAHRRSRTVDFFERAAGDLVRCLESSRDG